MLLTRNPEIPHLLEWKRMGETDRQVTPKGLGFTRETRDLLSVTHYAALIVMR